MIAGKVVTTAHEKRLDSLEDAFKEKVKELLRRVEKATGRSWILTDGYRSLREQAEIYAQGRTKKGKVVTKAKAGFSPHNYRMAADLAPLGINNSKIDWEAPREMWKLMADIAVELGLTAGFYFKGFFDGPHVEDKRWEKLKDDWLSGKLPTLK